MREVFLTLMVVTMSVYPFQSISKSGQMSDWHQMYQGYQEGYYCCSLWQSCKADMRAHIKIKSTLTTVSCIVPFLTYVVTHPIFLWFRIRR